MKKRPNNQLTGSSVPAILVTLCLAGSSAFAADYFHLGVDGTRIGTAANYSNTDGDTTAATDNPGSADNLFFFNSAAGAGPLDRRLEVGGAPLSFNSMTFSGIAGTIQIDRGAAPGTTSSTVTSIGAGGITVAPGAGPVTFGRLADSGNNQRVIIGAVANFSISNNSSANLTFNRVFDGRTNNTTHVITVGGSGNGNTIFVEGIRANSSGRDLAMIINKTSGSGVVRFNGVNNYTGDTTVTAGTLALADNAQLRFVLGATSGVNNRISGAGTVTLDGDFFIDTAAADALPSGTWTLEDVASLTGAYGATFTVVGFTDAGGDKWTKDTVAGKLYTFDETTGILTLKTTASACNTWKANNASGSNPGDDTRTFTPDAVCFHPTNKTQVHPFQQSGLRLVW